MQYIGGNITRKVPIPVVIYLGEMYYMKLLTLESIGMGAIGKLTLTPKVKSKKD